MNDPLEELSREIASLRRALRLLHRIANLLRESLEEQAACYAVLTGVTAGVGLGFNRAMLFLSERIRSSMADAPFQLTSGVAVQVTCSIGFATLEEGQTASELVAAADAALYEAKHGGKNRVVQASAR